MRVCTFNPSLGFGWQEILSWYLVQWAMEMVVVQHEAQQELSYIGDTGSPDWHWYLGGTTYHSPDILVDCNCGGVVGLAVEHTHLLGDFWSIPTTNQFVGKLRGFSWYDSCAWDHTTIIVLWQEFVGGGGTDRIPDSALYGAGDFSHLCGAWRTWRSRAVVALLLVPREVHFLGPSRRIWMKDPLFGEHSNVMVEVMIQVRCKSMHMDTTLGHHIQGWVGASSMEQ